MKSYLWELYDWSVEQQSDTPSAELDFVAAASAGGGSSKLTIPGANRASEKKVAWYFNITATNWLGGVGWKPIEVGSMLFLTSLLPRFKANSGRNCGWARRIFTTQSKRSLDT